MIIDEDLVEWNYGDCEGTTSHEIHQIGAVLANLS
jgi:broad specificity phosphatase PhoE